MGLGVGFGRVPFDDGEAGAAVSGGRWMKTPKIPVAVAVNPAKRAINRERFVVHKVSL